MTTRREEVAAILMWFRTGSEVGLADAGLTPFEAIIIGEQVFGKARVDEMQAAYLAAASETGATE
jgi:hypothetical protein